MNTAKKVVQARYSDNYDYIIDSDCNRVELTDPRIVYIWTVDSNQYTRRIFQDVFKQFGKKCRIKGETSPEVLQYARKVCSGRECIPCNSLAGVTLMDIDRDRGEDEISVYMNIDQEGPCQNGAWPLLWETFTQRLELKNTIFCAEPQLSNYYMGLGYRFICRLITGVILGDFLMEAKNSLICLARDKEQALRIFETETEKLIEKLAAKKKTIKLRITWNLLDDLDFIRQAISEFSVANSSLKKWAKKISKIPLKNPVKESARVLIFGGLNVFFVHYPVTDYFLEQGVIPRIIDFSEGVAMLQAEEAVLYSFLRER